MAKANFGVQLKNAKRLAGAIPGACHSAFFSRQEEMVRRTLDWFEGLANKWETAELS